MLEPLFDVLGSIPVVRLSLNNQTMGHIPFWTRYEELAFHHYLDTIQDYLTLKGLVQVCFTIMPSLQTAR